MVLLIGASICSGYASNAMSEAVSITVKAKNGELKKYIRAGINGPQSKKLATDANGKITTILMPGNYNIVISERSRQMSFPLQVDEDRSVVETFILKW